MKPINSDISTILFEIKNNKNSSKPVYIVNKNRLVIYLNKLNFLNLDVINNQEQFFL